MENRPPSPNVESQIS